MSFIRSKYNHYVILFIVSIMFLTVCIGSFSSHKTLADSNSTEVMVHYHRFDSNYTNWDLWMWPYQPVNGNGSAYEFSGTDDFGATADVQMPGDNTQIGLIVRKNDWSQKNSPGDLHIDLTKGHEVWIVQGDPNIYYNLSDAKAAAIPSVSNAYLDDEKTVLTKLSNPMTLTAGSSGFTVTDKTTGEQILVTSAINANPASSSGQTDLVQLTLASAPDVSHTLQVDAAGYKSVNIIPRNVLNLPRYYYSGSDLGNVYSNKATAFHVWAPTASDVQVLLYNSETGPITQQLEMQKSDNGTWKLQVPGNLKNWFYLYQVTVNGKTQTAVDPYVRAVSVNATRGMIVDLEDTNPAGWKEDHQQTPANPVDEVIYEAHVRDFSIDANSGMNYKGRYLAFTEHGTKGPNNVKTGIDSLKKLGITTVQLQPVEEFNSIDETQPNMYNWGYDPRNYNVPEGAYATTPEGTARITQLKQLIQSLHQDRIGINMDVVYNHTFSTLVSDFDKIVPQYYYRTDSAGNYTNGSGCGNEVAIEHPMAQKFVLDSVKYWVTEYHIDGFRFDLMALLGTDTMAKISKELHAINPGIVLYGEPWTGGTSGLPSDQLLTKGQQKGLGIGVFNDNIRNGLDGNVFEKSAQGFATGDPNQVDIIKNGVIGSIQDFTSAPSETINYVTSHDNMTLLDKIMTSNPNDSQADRIKMDELAQAVVFTSQGVPFMQGGEEMLRTKGGNDNSYNAGDQVNQFDWSRKAQFENVFDYYSGLIHLRDKHPAFRMTTADQIKQHLTFLDSPTNTVAFQLKDYANHDKWKNIIVMYNPNKTSQTLTLPSGNWTIVGLGDQVGENSLGHVTGKVQVPAISTIILKQ
ncbi:type I pullulanase [Neobacillus ginsengisoli]|uniref:pullulanase n=1 Tax=Neobacillus ginsengisoli TaxID=904295 RepID=A0ABT9Y3E6_9BACI|nr:type I pullulanase [Neobacillus ginsengisoli]MDQ0202066.1 pullulanase [Neobacillus ginsengisoli]